MRTSLRCTFERVVDDFVANARRKGWFKSDNRYLSASRGDGPRNSKVDLFDPVRGYRNVRTVARGRVPRKEVE